MPEAVYASGKGLLFFPQTAGLSASTLIVVIVISFAEIGIIEILALLLIEIACARIACACGILYLTKRDLKYDMYGAAAVEIGMLCCTLTLITGSIWGRHSWGVWWTWDPRLTTALILWFIYAGCMALRAMPMPEGRRASLCSVVAIAGVLDVPLVFLSARLWRSIHPSVFASKGGGLEPEMAVAVAASVLCFGLIWAALLILRSRQLVLGSRLDAMMFDRMMAEDEKLN